MKSKFFSLFFFITGIFLITKPQSPPIRAMSIDDFHHLLENDKFEQALHLFKIASQAKRNEYNKTIILETIRRLAYLSYEEFIQSFLKPVFKIEPYLFYEPFIQYLADNINFLIRYYDIRLLLLFNNFTELEAEFERSNHFNKLERESFFSKTSTARKIISSKIAQNIMLINDHPQLIRFLGHPGWILKDFPFDEAAATAINHIKELTPLLAELLLFKSHNHQLAKAIISEKRFPEYLTRFAHEIIEYEISPSSSPTLLHLQRYWDSISVPFFGRFFDHVYKPFLENAVIKNLYSSFRRKEAELNKKNYYTFVHGQERRFYFPERLYTHLWGLKKKQQLDNFFFAHVKDLIETPEAQLEEDIARKTIHMAGTRKESESDKRDIARRKKILFMNYAFFGNAQNEGSSSAFYSIMNQNSPIGQKVQVSVQEPFTLLGYDGIYQKHQQEIEQLAEDYANLSSYGNILLIAIPKDKIYKYVYLCKSGGLQQPLAKKDGTQITDIRVAMETLLKDPESLVDSDQVEFCLIMTQIKGGLDPSTGIQIFPFLSGDPEKLKALQAREKILLDKITVDVKEAEKQQALQRAAKITGHVVESTQAK